MIVIHFNEICEVNCLKISKTESSIDLILENQDYINIFENKLKDLKNGFGVLYNKKSEIIYKGEFKNGKMSGTGQYFYGAGEYYEGQWKRDVKSGYGIKFFKNLFKTKRPKLHDFHVNP